MPTILKDSLIAALKYGQYYTNRKFLEVLLSICYMLIFVVQITPHTQIDKKTFTLF